MNTPIKKIWTGACVLILFISTILLTSCDNKKEEAKDATPTVEEKATEPKSDNTLATEEENIQSQDIAPAEDVAVAEQDDLPEKNTTKAEEKESGSHPVHMSMWGNAGGTTFNFDMNGKTGSYIPYDFAEGKEYGARRQLKLVSYSPKDGRCVINAYLKGKYIGQFDGTFFEEDGEHFIQTYHGIFYSVNGAKLDFNFHFD